MTIRPWLTDDDDDDDDDDDEPRFRSFRTKTLSAVAFFFLSCKATQVIIQNMEH